MLRTVIAAAAIASAVPAGAVISAVDFTGPAVVTFSSGSTFYFTPPPRGTHLQGVGHINFATALADDFTGVVDIRQEDVDDGLYSFTFSIGDARGSSNYVAYYGGNASFTDGTLTGISLYADDDGEYAAISGTKHEGSWVGDRLNGGATWGGRFRLDVASAVPEPTTWYLLLTGFGLVGAALRRRTLTA